MILYRLTKTKYLSTAWTGYGAKEAGGRWNCMGPPHIAIFTL
ncbi:RES domain-containing protein, partial [Klebsiella pneumoniae]